MCFAFHMLDFISRIIFHRTVVRRRVHTRINHKTTVSYTNEITNTVDVKMDPSADSNNELNTGGGHHAGGGTQGPTDTTSTGQTTIYREVDEDDEEQVEVEVDITDAHYKYTKLRSQFGKQTQFLEDRPRIHCGLRANIARYHPLFTQMSYVNKAEDTLTALRELGTNTARAEYRSFSVLHTEGGWPREVNVREHDIVERTRRRLQREESFMDAVPNLAREAEYLVKHNNTLGLCGRLNKKPYTSRRDSKPYANVIAVYKCPTYDTRRPVSRISFAPGNQGRMAVAYCPYEFDPTFRENSCEAFFWEVENATRPEGMVRSAAQIVDLQYHPTDVHSICGALFTGQVCTWDNRVGPNPQSISSFETSHEDVCTRAMWTNKKGAAHEFFSTGLDGAIVWWDERNLSNRIESVFSDVEIGRNDPKQAVPITVLEYNSNMPDKFIVGSQFGQVMPFIKGQKQVAKTKSQPKKSSGAQSQSRQSMERSNAEGKSQQQSNSGGDDEEDEEEEQEEEEGGEEEEEEEEGGEEEEEEEEGGEEEEDEDEEEQENYDDEGEDEDDDEFSERLTKMTVRTPPPEEEEEFETVLGPFEIVTVYEAHRGPVNAIQRCPAFPNYFLSCGGYHLRFYSEEVLDSGIMWTSPGDALYSYCQWLKGRPCSVVASRIDGCLEFWDLLQQGSSSILTTRICEEALSTVCCADEASHIAVGTVYGDIRLVQVCPSLSTFDDNDKDALGQLFYREARREQHLAERMRALKKDEGSTAASGKPSKTASAKTGKSAGKSGDGERKSGKDKGKGDKDKGKDKGKGKDGKDGEKEPKKPDPFKNPDILVDKKFFDMLAEEKKRQGINAFPDKKGTAQAYSKMLVDGRQSEKQKAMEKSRKVSDSELGAQEMLDVNDSLMKKADALLEESDNQDEDEEEEGEDGEELEYEEGDEEEGGDLPTLKSGKSGVSQKSGKSQKSGAQSGMDEEEEEEGDATSRRDGDEEEEE